MIAESTIEVYGTDGEPCTGCRAPLTGTQRYCLQCGTRRPQARAEVLDILAADARDFGPGVAPAAAVTGPPPAAGGAEAWLRARSPFLALGGLLLGTLLVGLLIGHWATATDTPATAAAPAPQVIRIQGGAAPAATTTTADPAAATSATSTKKTAKTAKKATTAAKTVTIPKTVKDVSKLSSKDIDKAAKKGEPISTGSGALPPTDNKPAAGGTSFEDIG